MVGRFSACASYMEMIYAAYMCVLVLKLKIILKLLI